MIIAITYLIVQFRPIIHLFFLKIIPVIDAITIVFGTPIMFVDSFSPSNLILAVAYI